MSLGQWIICGSWITLIVLAIIWLGDEASLLSPLLLSALLSLIGFAHGLLVANAIISSLVGAGQHTGTASSIGNATHDHWRAERLCYYIAWRCHQLLDLHRYKYDYGSDLIVGIL